MTPRRKDAASKTADRGSLSLSQLCSEAADHVARARFALFDESYDAERALLHLDEAIFCLKRILAHGRSPAGARSGLRSA